MASKQLHIHAFFTSSLWVIAVMALAWPHSHVLAGFTPTPPPTTPIATTPAPTAPRPEKNPKDTPTPTVTQTVDPLTATPGLLPQAGGQATGRADLQAMLLMGTVACVLMIVGLTIYRMPDSRKH